MARSQLKKVFIFLDAEKHATPFDILTVIDVIHDCHFLKYESVTPEDVAAIVYDAMFPRGEEGAKDTKIFINGKDLETVRQILEEVKSCMFPPFELAVIVDPRGAFTTAAAAVAKTNGVLTEKSKEGLVKKNVTVLAGTGPVGQTAVKLFAYEKADVTVTSRTSERAELVASKVNGEVGEQRVRGIGVHKPEDVGKAIEEAEVILAAGAAKVQLLSSDVLRKYGSRCLVLADINAIPPLGVEGLEPDSEKKIMHETIGVGGLTIGRLKNKVEAQVIRTAADEAKGVFDEMTIYRIAKELVSAKPKKKQDQSEPMKYWLP